MRRRRPYAPSVLSWTRIGGIGPPPPPWACTRTGEGKLVGCWRSRLPGHGTRRGGGAYAPERRCPQVTAGKGIPACPSKIGESKAPALHLSRIAAGDRTRSLPTWSLSPVQFRSRAKGAGKECRGGAAGALRLFAAAY